MLIANSLFSFLLCLSMQLDDFLGYTVQHENYDKTYLEEREDDKMGV